MSNYQIRQDSARPFEEFEVKEIGFCRAALVEKNAGSASVTAGELAYWCELVNQSNITACLDSPPKALKSLLGNDFSAYFGSDFRVVNPKNTEAWRCIPIEYAMRILAYYAFEARGHSDRKKAKALFHAISAAGGTMYIYGLVGYRVQLQAPAVSSPPVVKPVEYSELEPADVRVTKFVSALKDADIELNNPRYAQAIKDRIIDIVRGPQLDSPALPAAPSVRWLSVAEWAEALGVPPYQVEKVRSDLGKKIKAWFVSKYGEKPRTETRLCNGRNCEIYIYEACPELDEQIKAYFKRDDGTSHLRVV